MKIYDTITTHIIGYDKSAGSMTIYLKINWSEESWEIYGENDQWMGFAEGGGTDSDAAEYIKHKMLGEDWFESAMAE